MPLAASAIITLATQIAKCPGFTSQAGNLLNMVLSDLCQDYDLELARGYLNFSFNSAAGNAQGPYTLPADFLRANRNSVVYTIQGVKYTLIGLEYDEYLQLVQQAGLAAYPENYAVDRSPLQTQGAPVMYVWPPAAGSYPVTGPYQRQMPDLTAAQLTDGVTVPWFNSQNYLITRLAGELMKITNDDRVEKFLGNSMDKNGAPFGAAAILEKYLESAEDAGDVVHTVTLDRRRVGQNFNRLPNTKQIGW